MHLCQVAPLPVHAELDGYGSRLFVDKHVLVLGPQRAFALIHTLAVFTPVPGRACNAVDVSGAHIGTCMIWIFAPSVARGLHHSEGAE